MSKKHRQSQQIASVLVTNASEIETETIVAIGTDIEPSEIEFQPRYICPEHSGCEALRPKNNRKYGVVQHTETINTATEMIVTRYCKCRFCGESYKHVETITHVSRD